MHWKRPLSSTKIGHLLAQKAADLLHSKRPLSCTKGGRFIALKAAALWHKNWLLVCPKRGWFIAQKSVSLLHRKQLLHKCQAEFLNRKQPLSLCHFMATGPPSWLCWALLFINCTYEMLTAILWLSMELDVSSCYYQNEKMCIEQSGTKVWGIIGLRRDPILLCNSFCGDLPWVGQNMFIEFAAAQLDFQITVSTSTVLQYFNITYNANANKNVTARYCIPLTSKSSLQFPISLTKHMSQIPNIILSC